MIGYYFTLALRNLQRNIVLSVLMIIAIGVGIGASMTMLTIFRAASGDPIPGKSTQLFVPQIDNFGPEGRWRGDPDFLPPVLTYFDVTAWMRAHAGVRQAAMYPTSLSITPPDPTQIPLQVYARATYRDFFAMFDVPFKYGGPWSRAEDDSHASVVVLSRALNDQLLGGADSVGRTLTIGTKVYRINGVMDEWHPSPASTTRAARPFPGRTSFSCPSPAPSMSRCRRTPHSIVTAQAPEKAGTACCTPIVSGCTSGSS